MSAISLLTGIPDKKKIVRFSCYSINLYPARVQKFSLIRVVLGLELFAPLQLNPGTF